MELGVHESPNIATATREKKNKKREKKKEVRYLEKNFSWLFLLNHNKELTLMSDYWKYGA